MMLNEAQRNWLRIAMELIDGKMRMSEFFVGLLLSRCALGQYRPHSLEKAHIIPNTEGFLMPQSQLPAQ